MTRGVNKVILIGNLGRDPEVRQTQTGKSVARLNLATTETFPGRDGGERQERTEWHRVTIWGALAEVVEQYLRSGSKVYIEGRLQTSTYEKEGQTHYSTEVVANQMVMLDSRGSGGDSYGGGGGRGGQSSGGQGSGGQGSGGGGDRDSGSGWGGGGDGGSSSPADSGLGGGTGPASSGGGGGQGSGGEGFDDIPF